MAEFNQWNYLGIVSRLFDDFGCHPERRTDEGISFTSGIRQLTGYTEVGQLDIAHFAQQNIRCYKIEKNLSS